MEGILAHMVWVWIAVMALAAFVEAATPMLVSIWFSVGALAAMGAAAVRVRRKPVVGILSTGDLAPGRSGT